MFKVLKDQKERIPVNTVIAANVRAPVEDAFETGVQAILYRLSIIFGPILCNINYISGKK